MQGPATLMQSPATLMQGSGPNSRYLHCDSKGLERREALDCSYLSIYAPRDSYISSYIVGDAHIYEPMLPIFQFESI